MTEQEERCNRYAMLIAGKIRELFKNEETGEESELFNEICEGSNATEFIHAMANIAPAVLYRVLTNDSVSMLEFNHIANNLCFKYGKIDKE